MADQYTAVIIGVSVSVGACALALIVFVIIFCRLRIKEDSNVRKRIITKKAFPEKRPETPPPPEPEPIPMPVIMPPPPPQPVLIPRPIRLQPLPPPPLPPPPPLEPRVIVREIYHNSEESEPTPVLQRVRRRSWAGSSDEWVMVKKTKRRNRRAKRSDDSCSSSSNSDSSDSDDECKKRTKPKHVAYPAMMAVQRCAVPRLEPYDLAMSNNNGLNARAAPRVLNIVPVNPGMRPFAPVSQPTVMMPGVSGNQLGYVSVMMPQQLQ